MGQRGGLLLTGRLTVGLVAGCRARWLLQVRQQRQRQGEAAAIRNAGLQAVHPPVLLRSEMCRPKGRNRRGGVAVWSHCVAVGSLEAANSRAACRSLCSRGSFQSRSVVPGSEPATKRLITCLESVRSQRCWLRTSQSGFAHDVVHGADASAAQSVLQLGISHTGSQIYRVGGGGRTTMYAARRRSPLSCRAAARPSDIVRPTQDQHSSETDAPGCRPGSCRSTCTSGGKGRRPLPPPRRPPLRPQLLWR